MTYTERRAAAEPEGLLVLHHGRGTDELDLLGLADALDPRGRLHVVAPRAPLTLPGSPGYHWYLVPRVGFPDHDTFHAARAALGELHDGLWERTGIDPSRTVLGGFSMGTVMSYAMALSGERPPVAGVLAFSGFVPTVEDWRPRFEDRRETRASLPTAARTRSSASTSPTGPATCSRRAGSKPTTTSRTSDIRSTPRICPRRSGGWTSRSHHRARLSRLGR